MPRSYNFLQIIYAPLVPETQVCMPTVPLTQVQLRTSDKANPPFPVFLHFSRDAVQQKAQVASGQPPSSQAPGEPSPHSGT